MRRWSAAERCQDIAVVVSELLTNALRHALPGPGDARPRRPVRLGLLQLRPCVGWLREVAPQRGLLLRWRSLSLAQRDGAELPPSMPEHIRALASAAKIQSHRLLRVFEALRAQSREDNIGGLYQMWGERLFGGPARTGASEPPAPELVAELVAAVGLPDEFAAAADDESWDAALSDSLDAASKACGPHPLSPTIVLDESLTGLCGPVFSPAPAGKAALRTWDAVRVLLAEPGFFELRRARTGPPAFAAG